MTGFQPKKHIDNFAGYRIRRGMDSGLSWADQWDSHQDPLPPASKDDKKEREVKQSISQKLRQKIKKVFGKKSEK